MRLQSIELITRKDGFFFHPTNGRIVKAYYKNSGVGVCVRFVPSQLDSDFQYLFNSQFNEMFWFPTAKQIENILSALDKSDEKTFQMLKTEWGGERPRKLKVADFL
jgi:hypothetical protein